MQHSIVNYSKLEKDSHCLRIDAEFFKKIYLNIEKLLKSQRHKLLKEYGVTIIHPSEIKREYVENNGVLFLRAQNVRPLRTELDSNRVYITKEDAEKLLNNQIQQEDILITRTGANFGQCAIYLEKEKAIASSHTFIVRSNKLNPYYLTIFFNTNYGRKMLDKGMYGGVQPEIAPFYIYQIPIPSFGDNFTKIIQNTFKESFSNFETSKLLYMEVENNLLRELNLVNWHPKHKLSYINCFSDTQSAERIDAEYFQPKYEEILNAVKNYSNGWDTLKNIVSLKKCIEVGSEAYKEEGIPFVRVSNLNKFELNENNQQYISEEYYKELAENFQPKKDEILLSKDGTAGITYYVNNEPKKMIPCGGILRLKVKNKEYLPEYITLVLNSLIVQEQIERVLSGALIKHWLIDQINNTVIPKLSLDKQKEIVVKIKESFRCREQSKQLLEIAKQGVEKAIEENEEIATDWINQELIKLGVNL